MNAELEKLVVIAKDSNMFPEVLKSLYAMFKDNEDFNTELRKGLSENPNCPTDVLEKLIKDNCDEVRINVAKHKKANDKMLSVCTKDENRLVRLAAVNNHNASEDILIVLMKDEDPEIVSQARSNLKQRL